MRPPLIRPGSARPPLGRLLWPAAVVAAIAANAPAAAAPIASESFVYPVGSTIAPWGASGQAGGTGWSAPWYNNHGNDMVVVDGLSYPGVHSSGGAAYNPGHEWTAGSGLEPAISTTVRSFAWDADEPDLWISFLLRPDDSAYAFDTAAWAGINIYSGGGIFIGKPGDGPDPSHYALQDDNSYVSAAGVVGPEALRTDLLLVHLRAGAPGTGIAELWVNPFLGAPLGTPHAHRDDLSLQNGGTYLLNLNSRGFYTTDELRLGTTLAEVPVPAPLPLIAAGLAVLAAARRRAVP